MDATRLAFGLLGVLLLVSSVHVSAKASAQPPMFHRAVLGANGGRAKPMSNDYYSDETQTLCFRDTVINNCGAFGCPSNITGNNRDCWTDVYAESQLTCQQEHHHDNYEGYNSYGSSFPGAAGHTAITNVASCSWEFHKFTQSVGNNANWKILLPDGVTEKLGTVKGVCTINHGAEHCGEGFKDGPVCGGSVITIDAGYYKTSAWWTSPRKTPIQPDGLMQWTNAAGVRANYPSCCVLDAVNAIDSDLCPTDTDWTVARHSRRLLEEGVGTANSYDHYTGTYYTGSATVIWGPFNVVNMATGEKWDNTGVMQWVPWATYTGTVGAAGSTPPPDAFYVEPNTYRFEFKKGSSYRY